MDLAQNLSHMDDWLLTHTLQHFHSTGFEPDRVTETFSAPDENQQMVPVGVTMETHQRTGGQALCHVTHPVELLLQFFIGVVDAELFKAVPLKRLKPAPTEKSSCTIDN